VCDLDEYVVAREVTESVIDLPEPVQVDGKNGDDITGHPGR
jgi:hypothetical protein